MASTLTQYSLKVGSPCNRVAWSSYDNPITIQLLLPIGFFQCVIIHTSCGPAFFTCVPTRWARLAFYYFCEKLIFGKKVGVATYFILFFKRENKTRNKTLKNDSIIFGKACL